MSRSRARSQQEQVRRPRNAVLIRGPSDWSATDRDPGTLARHSRCCAVGLAGDAKTTTSLANGSNATRTRAGQTDFKKNAFRRDWSLASDPVPSELGRRSFLYRYRGIDFAFCTGSARTATLNFGPRTEGRSVRR